MEYGKKVFAGRKPKEHLNASTVTIRPRGRPIRSHGGIVSMGKAMSVRTGHGDAPATMIDAGHAGACRFEAESRIALLAGRSSGMRVPAMGPWVQRWACNWEACEGFEASNDLVAAACGWAALQVSRLDWSHRPRFRCPDWAPARSDRPAQMKLARRQVKEVVQHCAALTWIRFLPSALVTSG